jgi:hypothetical protein
MVPLSGEKPVINFKFNFQKPAAGTTEGEATTKQFNLPPKVVGP